MEMNILFEKMEKKHQEPIMSIYNYYVENGTAAFRSTPLQEEGYESFLNIAKSFPAYVIVNGTDSKVIGFCMLSDYISHDSFRSTASLTYFIAPEYTGMGLGSKCLQKLEAEAISMGICNLIADISSENNGSIYFHKKHGFSIVGELDNIGSKFGRNFGIVLMQKKLQENK